MIVIAVWANFFVSLISAGFAIVALYRPTLLSQSIGGSTDDRFFVFMYAARSIPFGILTGVLPLGFANGDLALCCCTRSGD